MIKSNEITRHLNLDKNFCHSWHTSSPLEYRIRMYMSKMVIPTPYLHAIMSLFTVNNTGMA